LLVIDARVESAEGQDITVILSDARSLVEAQSKNARSVNISLPTDRLSDEYLHDILTVLNNASGKCDVYLDLIVDDLNVKLHSKPIRIQGSLRLESELRNRGCEVSWVL
jgi:hypothetical protein